MRQADLTAMTVAELKALAKRKKIVLSAGAKKADIVKALSRPAASAAAKPKKATAKKAAATTAGARKKTGKVAPKKAAAKKAVSAKPKVHPAVAPEKAPIARKPATTPPASREWQMPMIADQERIVGAKYFTGPGGAETVAPSLPASYGDERIVILSRDPFVLFGYWDISRDRIERERMQLGAGSKLCVRIYDITGVSFDGSNATAIFDQEVYARAGSWYFHLARPTRRFCADIGLLAPDGKFLTLHRSNTVSMPRESISDLTDDAWMVSDEAFLKLHGLAQGIGGVSSAQIREALRSARMHGISSHGLFSPQGRAPKRK